VVKDYANLTVGTNPYLRGFIQTPEESILSCPSLRRIRAYDPHCVAYGYNMGGLSSVGFEARGPYIPGFRDGRLGLGGQTLVEHPLEPRHVRPTIDGDVLCPSSMVAVGDEIISPSYPSQDLSLPWISFFDDLSLAIVDPDTFLYHISNNGPLHKQRHMNRWNVVFCDGHVENLREARLFDNRDPEVLKLWNKDNEPHPELKIYVYTGK
jgi:prepilin-type processing-associated H-X9-DG protein